MTFDIPLYPTYPLFVAARGHSTSQSSLEAVVPNKSTNVHRLVVVLYMGTKFCLVYIGHEDHNSFDEVNRGPMPLWDSRFLMSVKLTFIKSPGSTYHYT